MQKTSVFSDFYCLPNKLALLGLRPIFFGPCTLRRTWGTRPISFHSSLPFPQEEIEVAALVGLQYGILK
jgi:hypothetical protein